ncbi:MAG: metallopeptidase family protein [Proteobacteria bacterium]|nr:metallopeptidase family protein [Pseudomonadota bacterium]
MHHDFFEQFVAKAWNNLPKEFHAEMDNIDVVIEDWPDSEAMRQAGVKHRSQILGLYHGVPLTKRTRSYNLVLPDKISIYRQPIMMRCCNWEEVLRMIHRVLRHEVGHYFGLSDDRLREIGAY